MVCTAPIVVLGPLVTIDTAGSPMSLSRLLNDTKLGVSCPPSSLRIISPESPCVHDTEEEEQELRKKHTSVWS